MEVAALVDGEMRIGQRRPKQLAPRSLPPARICSGGVPRVLAGSVGEGEAHKPKDEVTETDMKVRVLITNWRGGRRREAARWRISMMKRKGKEKRSSQEGIQIL